MSTMSRAITAIIIGMAGVFVGLAAKNMYAGSATALVLASLDCILQDAVRRFKQ
jgi:hypothetical protein